MKLLEDEHETVRSNAARSLGIMGDTVVEEALNKALEKEKDTWVRAYLSEALGMIRSRKGSEGRKKILVVDDDKFISKFITSVLSSEGYELDTAYDGSEALEKVEASKPDLILLDIMMPVMDGWETAEKLKLNPETKSIPVIIVTAKSQEKDVQKGEELGVACYMIKPFNPLDLTKTIREILSVFRG
jgi:CheY-like chemotaxis protein